MRGVDCAECHAYYKDMFPNDPKRQQEELDKNSRHREHFPIRYEETPPEVWNRLLIVSSPETQREPPSPTKKRRVPLGTVKSYEEALAEVGLKPDDTLESQYF